MKDHIFLGDQQFLFSFLFQNMTKDFPSKVAHESFQTNGYSSILQGFLHLRNIVQLGILTLLFRAHFSIYKPKKKRKNIWFGLIYILC